MPDVELDPIESPSELEETIDTIFADPQARMGMGWGPEDDLDEAMRSIRGLWRDRFEAGWHLFRVHWGNRLAGFTGLGPGTDGRNWYAIYLLERGQGLGSQVTDDMLDIARAEKIPSLIAITREGNQACRRLLTSHGFTLQGPAPYEWAQESPLTWLVYRREIGPEPA